MSWTPPLLPELGLSQRSALTLMMGTMKGGGRPILTVGVKSGAVQQVVGWEGANLQGVGSVGGRGRCRLGEYGVRRHAPPPHTYTRSEP